MRAFLPPGLNLLLSVSLGCAAPDSALDSAPTPAGSTGQTNPASTTGTATSVGTTLTNPGPTTADVSTGPGTGSTAATTALDDTGDTTSGSESSGSGGIPYTPGCPDRWPAEWVACEDFEQVDDPYQDFGAFISIDQRVGVDPGEGLDGSSALRQRFEPDAIFSGRVDIRFGQGPAGGHVFDPDATFDDLWVRTFWRHDANWTGDGWGDLLELESLDAVQTIAWDGLVIVTDEASALYPWSCIHGAELLCEGPDQWSDPDMRALAQVPGQSGPYGAAAADQWHCSVLHVRANTPGQTDGLMELWTNGQPDVDLGGLDFRGTWTAYGLNNVRLNAWWDTVPALTHRFFDDIVVSQAPLSCP